jgi:hypothetical protein
VDDSAGNKLALSYDCDLIQNDSSCKQKHRYSIPLGLQKWPEFLNRVEGFDAMARLICMILLMLH